LQHAVKLAIWGDRHLFFDPANSASCYRWPADRCDASAPDAGSLGYHGTDPALVQGALLALPPQITADQLGLETAPGKLLFGALQDYGAYVVGNSGSDAVLLGFEALAVADFERTYGYQPESEEPGSEAWSADVRKMVQSLQLIANNGPSSVGGGGAPRRELAPPFRD